MKISKRDRALLIMLVGVAILALCWFFVVDPTNVKTDALKNQNVQLKSTADTYRAVSANADQYEKGILQFKEQLEEIQAPYPSQIKRTDQVMYLANMENIFARDLKIKSMSMSAMAEVATNAGEEGGTEATVKLYKMPLSYSFLCTYDGFKDMVNYIFEDGDRKSINVVTLAFDSETGNLQGNITVDLYTLTGTDKEYKPTTIPPTTTGINDIFHTVNGRIGVNAVANNAQKQEEAEDSE